MSKQSRDAHCSLSDIIIHKEYGAQPFHIFPTTAIVLWLWASPFASTINLFSFWLEHTNWTRGAKHFHFVFFSRVETRSEITCMCLIKEKVSRGYIWNTRNNIACNATHEIDLMVIHIEVLLGPSSTSLGVYYNFIKFI